MYAVNVRRQLRTTRIYLPYTICRNSHIKHLPNVAGAARVDVSSVRYPGTALNSTRTTVVMFDVWHPGQLTLKADDEELRRSRGIVTYYGTGNTVT